MSHLGQVKNWVKSELSAVPAIRDHTNGTHDTIAVEGEPAPYIILTQRGEPAIEHALCGAIVAIRATYEVNVVAVNTGFPRIEDIEDAINATLDNRKVPASGERPTFSTRTVSLAQRVGVETGGMFFRAGGVFEFLVTP